MRVGLLYDTANPPDGGRDTAGLYAHELDQIERAEGWGVDGIWFTEHHFTADYAAAPLVWMAAAAARTRRVRLGAGILIPALYHPVRLAEDLATIDAISGGRIELGVGLGWALEEFRVFGVDPARRAGITRDAVEVLRRAWRDETFSFAGEYFQFDGVRVRPRPVQRELKIWGGASTAAGAARVARWGMPLLWVEPAVSQAYLDAWAAAGRPAAEAEIDGYINLFVCDDPEAAWPEVRECFLYQALRPDIKSQRAGPGGTVLARAAYTLDDVEARRLSGDIIVATPQQAVAAVRARAAGAPVTGFFCHNRICGMSDALSDRHVELLCKEVAPALRAL